MFGIKDANQNKEITNLINQFETTIIGIENIKAQINGKKTNPYTLVYTPIGFFIISRVNLMRKFKAKVIVSLFDILSFDYISKNEILCHFDHSQKILLEIDGYKPFIQSMLDHHSQLFYRSPFIKPIQFNNFPEQIRPTQPISSPSNPISLRYISICAKYQQPIDPETKRIFEIYEKSDRISITLNSKCQPPAYYRTISFTLMHEPLLHGLTFDQYSPHNVCKIIYSLLKYNKNITSIIMRNYNELTYEQFGFSNLKNPSVVSWHFSNLSLSEQRLSLFFAEFKNYQSDIFQFSLDRIHFSNNSADRLAKMIAFSHCFRSLEVFNLTYIDGSGQNINKILNSLQKTVSQLKSLQKVVFANWSPEPSITAVPKPPNSKSSTQLPNVFHFVRTTSVRFLSLASFDLRMVNGKIVLPSNLNCLELRKCKFTCCSLVKVLEAAQQIHSPCVLSLAEMEIDNSELQQFFQESSKLQPFQNLVELDYSCNSIPSHFVGEFNRIFITPTLKFLSLNNVFGPDQITDMSVILTQCHKTCKLWGLELMGGKIKKTIGPRLNEVFPFILLQNNLEHLNISAQQFTDMIINDVYKFFDTMKTLLYFSVDGSAIFKLNTLYSLYEHIFLKTKSRAITRPFMDLDSLILGNNLEETIQSSAFQTFKQRMLSQMIPSDRFIRTFYYIRYPEMNRFQTFLSAFPMAAIELLPNDKYGINCITPSSIPVRSLSDLDFQEIQCHKDIGTYQSLLFHSPFDNVRPLTSELKPFEIPAALKKFKGTYEFDSNLKLPEINLRSKIGLQENKVEQTFERNNNDKNENLDSFNFAANVNQNLNFSSMYLCKMINDRPTICVLKSSLSSNEIPAFNRNAPSPLFSGRSIPPPTYNTMNDNRNFGSSSDFHLQENTSNYEDEDEFIEYDDDNDYFSFLYDYEYKRRNTPMLPELPSTKVLRATKYGNPDVFFRMSSNLNENDLITNDSEYESDDENLNDDDDEQLDLLQVMINDPLQKETLKNLKSCCFAFNNFEPKSASKIRAIPNDPPKEDVRMPQLFDSLYRYKRKYCSRVTASSNFPMKHRTSSSAANLINLVSNEISSSVVASSPVAAGVRCHSPVSDYADIQNISINSSSNYDSINSSSNYESINSDFFDFDGFDFQKRKTKRTNSSGLSSQPIVRNMSSQLKLSHRFRTAPTNANNNSFSSLFSNLPIKNGFMSWNSLENISSEDDFLMSDVSGTKSQQQFKGKSNFHFYVNINLDSVANSVTFTVDNSSSSGEMLDDSGVCDRAKFDRTTAVTNDMKNVNVRREVVSLFSSDSESSDAEVTKCIQLSNVRRKSQNAKANSYSSNSGEASDDMQTAQPKVVQQSQQARKVISGSSESGEMSDDMQPPPDAGQVKKIELPKAAQAQTQTHQPSKAKSYSSESGEMSDDMQPPPDAGQVKRIEIPKSVQSQQQTQQLSKAKSCSSESGEMSDDMQPPPDAGQVKRIEFPKAAQTQTQTQQPSKAKSYSSESGEMSDDMQPPPDAGQVKKIEFPSFTSDTNKPETKKQVSKARSYSSESGEMSDDMQPPPDAGQVKRIEFPKPSQSQAQPLAKAKSYSSESGEMSDDMPPPPDANEVKRIQLPTFGQVQFQPPQTQTQQPLAKAASYSSESGEMSDDMMPPPDAGQVKRIEFPVAAQIQQQTQNAARSYSSESGEMSDDMMPPPDAKEVKKIQFPTFGQVQFQPPQTQQPLAKAASYSSESGEMSDDMMPPPDAQQIRKIEYPKF